MSKGEFAIIGTGQVPTGNFPERSEFEIAYTVAREAIRDAGIDKDEIGAVLCAQHIMSNPDNDYNTEMVFGRLPEADRREELQDNLHDQRRWGLQPRHPQDGGGHPALGRDRYRPCGARTAFQPVHPEPAGRLLLHRRLRRGVGGALRHDLQLTGCHDHPGLHVRHRHHHRTGGRGLRGLSPLGHAAAQRHVQRQGDHHREGGQRTHGVLSADHPDVQRAGGRRQRLHHDHGREGSKGLRQAGLRTGRGLGLLAPHHHPRRHEEPGGHDRTSSAPSPARPTTAAAWAPRTWTPSRSTGPTR